MKSKRNQSKKGLPSDDLRAGKIVLYKNEVAVRLINDSLWLSQKQISELFDKGLPAINEHIGNIYRERELDRRSTVRKIRIVRNEGGRQVSREIDLYSLDMIISVGYRVNSKRGTQFRIWATKVLRRHIIDGYTLNKKRLKVAEHKYLELKESLMLLDNMVSLEDIPVETKGLISVISQYSRALDMLDDYDHGRMTVPKGTLSLKHKFTYEEARRIIDDMKKGFKDSPLFGMERDGSFRSSLGGIYQTFDRRDVYPTVEEKAAHLLYFVVKNHSFIDGNKRIAAALFICFMQGNNILFRKDGAKRIDQNALVALTLMTAASKPAEKDVMIKVILNLLN